MRKGWSFETDWNIKVWRRQGRVINNNFFVQADTPGQNISNKVKESNKIR